MIFSHCLSLYGCINPLLGGWWSPMGLGRSLALALVLPPLPRLLPRLPKDSLRDALWQILWLQEICSSPSHRHSRPAPLSAFPRVFHDPRFQRSVPGIGSCRVPCLVMACQRSQGTFLVPDAPFRSGVVSSLFQSRRFPNISSLAPSQTASASSSLHPFNHLFGQLFGNPLSKRAGIMTRGMDIGQ